MLGLRSSLWSWTSSTYRFVLLVIMTWDVVSWLWCDVIAISSPCGSKKIHDLNFNDWSYNCSRRNCCKDSDLENVCILDMTEQVAHNRRPRQVEFYTSSQLIHDVQAKRLRMLRSSKCFLANCFQMPFSEEIPKVKLRVTSRLSTSFCSQISDFLVPFLPLSNRVVHTNSPRLRISWLIMKRLCARDVTRCHDHCTRRDWSRDDTQTGCQQESRSSFQIVYKGSEHVQRQHAASDHTACARPADAATCGRVVLGKGAKVLICESAQGICPHRGRWSWWPGGKTRCKERRWSAERGKWSSRRESEQTHKRMEMIHDTWCAHDKHTTWAKRVPVNKWENVTWLQQTTVSCKRSNCNKPKNLGSRHVWGCVKKRHNGSPFYLLLFTWAQLRTFLLIVMSSTRNRSTATKMCWMKRMMDAIAGITTQESARVALLQTLGVNGLIWSTLRWSQNDLSSVRFFQIYLMREIHQFFLYRKCSSSVFRLVKEIFLRILVHLDADFFSSINAELRFTKHGIVLEAIVNPFKICLDASLSQIMGNMKVSLFFSLPITTAMRSSLLDNIVRDWEKIQCPSEDASAGLILSQEMPASAVNDALIPVKKAFSTLPFRNCLA